VNAASAEVSNIGLSPGKYPVNETNNETWKLPWFIIADVCHTYIRLH